MDNIERTICIKGDGTEQLDGLSLCLGRPQKRMGGRGKVALPVVRDFLDHRVELAVGADQHPQTLGVLEQIQQVIPVLDQITGVTVGGEYLERLNALLLQLFKLLSDGAVVAVTVDPLV